LKDVDDEEQAKARGFVNGGKFKLLQFDIVLVREEKAKAGEL
jgi:hypothetical protein